MDFEIAYPWVFYLIPLPLLVVWLWPPARRRQEGLRAPAYFRILDVFNLEGKKAAWVSRRNAFGWIFLSLVWLATLATLSGPRYVGEPEKKIKTARSFLIAADISFSMDNRDWVIDGVRKSRWEAIQQLMSNFVEERKSDRMGLIFFGTHAYVQAPLTTDLKIIKWMMDQTEVGMAGQQTGIGNAVGVAMELFQRDTLDQKVLLLLTDGVDSGQGVSPLDAAQQAMADSVKIYTLGIGSSGASDLDEATLKQMAEMTGGEYFYALDSAELSSTYASLNALEPIEFEDESYVPIIHLYPYPLAVAVGLILLWMIPAAFFPLIRKQVAHGT
jgi:Ca-activated chloride channel family protein